MEETSHVPIKLYRSNLIKEEILIGIDVLTGIQISVPIAGDGFGCNVADDGRPEPYQLRGTVRCTFPFAGDRTAAVPAAGKVVWFIWGMLIILLIA